jgi:hypothetical protein
VVVPREGGFEYLHCGPTSRRGQRKWKPVPGGYNCATLLPGVYYEDLALQVGGDESETKCPVMSPAGLEPENDCADGGRQLLQTTHPAPRQQTAQLSDSNKNLVLGPRWVLDAKILG